MNFLRKRFVFVNFFGYRAEGLLKPLKLKDWALLYQENRAEWQEAQRTLRELSKLTSSRDLPAIVAMFPILINFKNTYPYQNVHDIVRREVEANNMVFADITPEFDGIDSRALWIHPNDRHPNAEGHSILANGILNALIQNDLVPQN